MLSPSDSSDTGTYYDGAPVFTGLVEAMGTVGARETRGGIVELTVETETMAPLLSLGDSVAVSGVCLTATGLEPSRFRVDVAQETLRRTTLERLARGDAVNLELPLRADARLGGHFVQGHVDGVGRVSRAGPVGGNYMVRIEHDATAAKLVVEKGSIAIDGVSLTVTGCGADWLEVMLIPHTLEVTTLGALADGDGVNLEYDILAKYMARFADAYFDARSE